jgi:hypothetical protein
MRTFWSVHEVREFVSTTEYQGISSGEVIGKFTGYSIRSFPKLVKEIEDMGIILIDEDDEHSVLVYNKTSLVKE